MRREERLRTRSSDEDRQQPRWSATRRSPSRSNRGSSRSSSEEGNWPRANYRAQSPQRERSPVDDARSRAPAARQPADAHREEAREATEATQVARQTTTFNVDPEESPTHLMVVEAKAVNEETGKSIEIDILFDGGAQLTTISDDLRRSLELPVLSTRTLQFSLYGNRPVTERAHFVKLKLESDGTVFSLAAPAVGQLVKPIERSELSDKDKQFLEANDIHIHRNFKTLIKPQIVIGNDIGWKLVDLKKPFLRTPNGLTMVPTVFGYTVNGREDESQSFICKAIAMGCQQFDNSYSICEEKLEISCEEVEEHLFSDSEEVRQVSVKENEPGHEWEERVHKLEQEVAAQDSEQRRFSTGIEKQVCELQSRVSDWEDKKRDEASSALRDELRMLTQAVTLLAVQVSSMARKGNFPQEEIREREKPVDEPKTYPVFEANGKESGHGPTEPEPMKAESMFEAR